MILPNNAARARWLASGAVALALSGCATFSPDAGLGAVQTMTAAHTGVQLAAPRTSAETDIVRVQVAALLTQPLTAQAAVQVALLNNPSLQAAYAELGIAESDLVQAGRLSNPTFSFSRVTGHEGVEIERKLMLPVIGLLTMPIVRPLEQRRFEQAQMRTALEVLRLADDTRRTYYSAVAAAQSAEFMVQVAASTEAGAELARRMVKGGNWSSLQGAREQSAHADAVAQLVRSRQAALDQREALVRLLGLASTSFTLPERLPELPAAARTIADSEAQAMANRIDILMAQKELAGLTSSLALTRTTRFINLLDLSYLHNNAASGERATGYEVELQIPLFDWGGARLAKAEAQYMQAVRRASSSAIDARSQVRTSYAGYQAAWVLARHYRDEVVPLKKRISDEQLLRYNGMLISVFELLADAREQVASVNASIEAQRDFWIADSALQAAMSGGSAGAAAPAAASTPAAAAPQH